MVETSVILPPDYKPSADEEYMNEMQVEYFRQKLLDWKKSLLAQSQDTLEELRQGGLNQPDELDRASMETDKALDLRTKDRARKLISKINDALKRIEDGTYGYCEETGEPIGVERLEARPVATLSIEAQERHERMEKPTAKTKRHYGKKGLYTCFGISLPSGTSGTGGALSEAGLSGRH